MKNSTEDHRPAGVYVTPSLQLATSVYTEHMDFMRVVLVVEVPDPAWSHHYRIWHKNKKNNIQWLFDQEHVKLVAIIFIGNTKLDDNCTNLHTDVTRRRWADIEDIETGKVEYMSCKDAVRTSRGCLVRGRKATWNNEWCTHSCDQCPYSYAETNGSFINQPCKQMKYQ